MKKTLLAIGALLCLQFSGNAQDSKIPVYANVALGYGNTFFYGTLADKETVRETMVVVLAGTKASHFPRFFTFRPKVGKVWALAAA